MSIFGFNNYTLNSKTFIANELVLVVFNDFGKLFFREVDSYIFEGFMPTSDHLNRRVAHSWCCLKWLDNLQFQCDGRLRLISINSISLYPWFTVREEHTFYFVCGGQKSNYVNPNFSNFDYN